MIYKTFDIKIAVNGYPKKHSLCNKAKAKESEKKEGFEKRKLVSKGSARELKTELQKQSKAKSKFNMKDIRKCHHPMHGAVSWTEGRTQPASGEAVSDFFIYVCAHILLLFY